VAAALPAVEALARGADERVRFAAGGRLPAVDARLAVADEEDLEVDFFAVDERFVVEAGFADAGFLGCGMTQA
jgi:hypothetical protein